MRETATDTVIEGPHKGKLVHPEARYFVAQVDDLEGKFAHYSRTPRGFVFEGLSISPTTLRTKA